MAPPAPPKEFVYPYSTMAQLRAWPFKWYWKNARMFRFQIYGYIAAFPFIYKIHKAVHSPGNVEEWKQRRAAREHTHFDTPCE
ncbi:uncharacterized protein [Watersipora subatra]|uniref:uncharacterized protein n=1 Tax=Watersipora subatra TaxID=2589382 RepID=UPI00355B5DA6